MELLLLQLVDQVLLHMFMSGSMLPTSLKDKILLLQQVLLLETTMLRLRMLTDVCHLAERVRLINQF